MHARRPRPLPLRSLSHRVPNKPGGGTAPFWLFHPRAGFGNIPNGEGGLLSQGTAANTAILTIMNTAGVTVLLGRGRSQLGITTVTGKYIPSAGGLCDADALGPVHVPPFKHQTPLTWDLWWAFCHTFRYVYGHGSSDSIMDRRTLPKPNRERIRAAFLASVHRSCAVTAEDRRDRMLQFVCDLDALLTDMEAPLLVAEKTPSLILARVRALEFATVFPGAPPFPAASEDGGVDGTVSLEVPPCVDGEELARPPHFKLCELRSKDPLRIDMDQFSHATRLHYPALIHGVATAFANILEASRVYRAAPVPQPAGGPPFNVQALDGARAVGDKLLFHPMLKP